MTSDEIVYLALVPPQAAEAGLAEKAAALIRKDPWSTRHLLSAKVPRIATQYRERQEAELTWHSLEGLGLTAFLISDAELRQPFLLFKAHAAELGGEEIVFRDRAGHESQIESKEAFLIIKGIAETRQEIEVTGTRKKINLPATLLTGGIPIKKTVREKTLETSVNTEYFLRVYKKPPEDLCIEIKPHGFDFSCLGKEMALSSQVNFAFLTRKIRERLPAAFFEDGVRETSGVTVPYVSHLDNLDVTCKLIYRYHQAFGRSSPSA
jgi:hypothetical protein